jgi:hypothetical protein
MYITCYLFLLLKITKASSCVFNLVPYWYHRQFYWQFHVVCRLPQTAWSKSLEIENIHSVCLIVCLFLPRPYQLDYEARVVGLLMNQEGEIIGKLITTVQSRYYLSICMSDWRKTWKFLVIITDDPAEIRTRNLPDTSLGGTITPTGSLWRMVTSLLLFLIVILFSSSF